MCMQTDANSRLSLPQKKQKKEGEEKEEEKGDPPMHELAGRSRGGSLAPGLDLRKQFRVDAALVQNLDMRQQQQQTTA